MKVTDKRRLSCYGLKTGGYIRTKSYSLKAEGETSKTWKSEGYQRRKRNEQVDADNKVFEE